MTADNIAFLVFFLVVVLPWVDYDDLRHEMWRQHIDEVFEHVAKGGRS
jgi:hypothetical protein